MPSSTACSPDAVIASAPVEPFPTLLQRVILPRRADPMAVRALYVDEQSATARRVWPPAGTTGVPDRRDVDIEVTLANPNARRVRALSRTSVAVPEQTEVSFAAYFNAFPASYWRRWTALRTVRLRLDLRVPVGWTSTGPRRTPPRSTCTVNW